MRLVVGLGNPGREFAHSRHNVGFRCLDITAQRLGCVFSRRASKALVAVAWHRGEKLLLAKPQGYMNLSGESVGQLVRYHRVELAQILIVYDDMDLPLGRIRIRPGGSSGGHHGLQSVVQTLATEAFPRMRIGIGRSALARGASYVLGRFSDEEEVGLSETLSRAADAIEVLVEEGLDAAMNRYNT